MTLKYFPSYLKFVTQNFEALWNAERIHMLGPSNAGKTSLSEFIGQITAKFIVREKGLNGNTLLIEETAKDVGPEAEWRHKHFSSLILTLKPAIFEGWTFSLVKDLEVSWGTKDIAIYVKQEDLSILMKRAKGRGDRNPEDYVSQSLEYMKAVDKDKIKALIFQAGDEERMVELSQHKKEHVEPELLNLLTIMRAHMYGGKPKETIVKSSEKEQFPQINKDKVPEDKYFIFSL